MLWFGSLFSMALDWNLRDGSVRKLRGWLAQPVKLTNSEGGVGENFLVTHQRGSLSNGHPAPCVAQIHGVFELVARPAGPLQSDLRSRGRRSQALDFQQRNALVQTHA